MDKEYTNMEFDNNPISLKDIIRKITRARWWVFTCVIFFLFITIYVTFSTPPKFEATASVMIEKSSKAQTIFNFGENDNFTISDEIAVILSRNVAEDVVKTLWNSNKRNRLYVFGTKVFIPRGQRLRRPIKKLFTFGRWNESESMPPKYNEPYNDEIGEQFYQNILNTINAYSKRNTNIISIVSTSPHPYEAALIANTVANAYKERDKEWSSNESMSLKFFLQERLNEKEIEIDLIEKKIEEYKRSNHIFDIEGDELLGESLVSTEEEYDRNEMEINLLQQQKNNISTKLSVVEQELAEKMLSTIHAQLFALREQINEKESELIRNETVYGSGHEMVLKTKLNLDNLKKQLEEKTNKLITAGLSHIDPLDYRQGLISELLQIETNIYQMQARSKELQLLINKYYRKMDSLPEKQAFLGKLLREREVLANTYSYMRQKMDEARVSMASEAGKVRIVNLAEEPDYPISPDIPRNIIMAIIIGIIFGLGINISIEYFDNSIRSVEFIERKKLPILAIIPSIGERFTTKVANKFFKNKQLSNNSDYIGSRTGNIERRLITHEEPTSPISEAYRGLRTSLMYTKKGTQGSIMVSSPGPGEGKTTTIINLAITYANLGKKTILIDGDLRKPVIHKVFGGKNNKGLTHYLSGAEENLDSIICSSKINNLDVIYNGAIPPNPSELLGSEQMDQLMQKLKKRYEIVLFDAPPILAVTDSVVLSNLTDQFILVIRFGSTDKDSIDFALNALDHVNTTLTGVVFNDLNQNNSYYSKSYYNYYQYSYGLEKDS